MVQLYCVSISKCQQKFVLLVEYVREYLHLVLNNEINGEMNCLPAKHYLIIAKLWLEHVPCCSGSGGQDYRGIKNVSN